MAKRTLGGEEIDPSVYATNYTEFTVKKKADAKIILIRLLMMAAYVAIVVGTVLVAWWLGALSFLMVVIAWYFTWPFTNIEYEYTLSSGDWKFEKNYGNRRKVEVLNKKVKDMLVIAPYTDEYYKDYKSCQKIYDFRKSANHKEDIYFAVFEENGKNAVILFQCTNKALKILKSYNKQNTVTVDTLKY